MDAFLRALPNERIHEPDRMGGPSVNVYRNLSVIAFQGRVQTAIARRTAESKQPRGVQDQAMGADTCNG